MGQSAEEQLAAHMNRLRGYLAGMVESWGLPERQERGCISTVKAISYEMQEDLAKWVKNNNSP